jgi:hypothetical protein
MILNCLDDLDVKGNPRFKLPVNGKLRPALKALSMLKVDHRLKTCIESLVGITSTKLQGFLFAAVEDHSSQRICRIGATIELLDNRQAQMQKVFELSMFVLDIANNRLEIRPNSVCILYR